MFCWWKEITPGHEENWEHCVWGTVWKLPASLLYELKENMWLVRGWSQDTPKGTSRYTDMTGEPQVQRTKNVGENAYVS